MPSINSNATRSIPSAASAESSEVKDDNSNVVLGEDGKPHKHQVLVGFRDSRTVFGFSDTDGDELPPVQLSGWDVGGVKVNLTNDGGPAR